VNFVDWGTDGENVHSCEHHAAFRRDISAMTIGPQENSPAAAFDVSARRYPPGDLMSAKRSNMATTTIDACSGPMNRCASSQADALIPMAGRTWQAASKS